MSNNYSEEFNQAYQPTLKFNLQAPNILPKCEKLLTASKLQELPGVIGELDINQVVLQCLSIHYLLKARLEKFLCCISLDLI